MGSIRTVPIDSEHGRTVVHLTYRGYPARFELITRRLPHLEVKLPERRWFFVDVPFVAGEAMTHGLEVVQLHRPDDQAVQDQLAELEDLPAEADRSSPSLLRKLFGKS